MVSFTQKYTIIQLLEDMPEDAEYSTNEWPLHVTIADTFAVDWQGGILLDELTELLARHKTVLSKASRDEYFGPKKETQVTLLDMSKDLLDLHNDLIDFLKKAGALFNDPQYLGSGFRAHATVQPHARLQAGDWVKFNELTLIDMFPGGDPYQRKLLKKMKLSNDDFTHE